MFSSFLFIKFQPGEESNLGTCMNLFEKEEELGGKRDFPLNFQSCLKLPFNLMEFKVLKNPCQLVIYQSLYALCT